jgi:hypothetical protein
MNPVQETVKRVYNPFFGALAKLRKATISFVMSIYYSVSLSASTLLPLDGFSRNLKDFSNIHREISSFFKIGQA